MKKPTLLLKVIQHLYQKEAAIKHSSRKGDAGYTLIELLVVVIMMGILATIAAPSWLGFINQRRVNAANEVVLRALQEAQSQAKNRKLSYSVSFRTRDDVPEIAIYQRDTTPSGAQWRSLAKELSMKPKQIILGTNLNGENEKQEGSINYIIVNSTNDSSRPSNKITFDHLGALDTANSDDPDTELLIAVAIRKGDDAIESTMRCVRVTTLLGSLKTGRGKSECPPTTSSATN